MYNAFDYIIIIYICGYIFKVQEISRHWLLDSEEFAGPVLHVTCSHSIQLLKPATITLPLTMKGDDNLSSSLSCIDVQVFENRDDGLSGWNEITKQLPGPAVLKNGVVTFQVTHFTRYVSDFC